MEPPLTAADLILEEDYKQGIRFASLERMLGTFLWIYEQNKSAFESVYTRPEAQAVWGDKYVMGAIRFLRNLRCHLRPNIMSDEDQKSLYSEAFGLCAYILLLCCHHKGYQTKEEAKDILDIFLGKKATTACTAIVGDRYKFPEVFVRNFIAFDNPRWYLSAPTIQISFPDVTDTTLDRVCGALAVYYHHCLKGKMKYGDAARYDKKLAGW